MLLAAVSPCSGTELESSLDRGMALCEPDCKSSGMQVTQVEGQMVEVAQQSRRRRPELESAENWQQPDAEHLWRVQVEGQRVEVAQQAATKAALSKLDKVRNDITSRAEALGQEADAEEDRVGPCLHPTQSSKVTSAHDKGHTLPRSINLYCPACRRS